MASETWRVVLANGDVREVRVEQIPSGRWAHWWHVVFDAMPPGGGTMPATVRPAGAVLGAMWTVGWDVRAMLAPGEPSRAELTAQRDAAWREGAEAMRAACIEVADDALRAHGAAERDPRADLEMRAAAWERGTAIEKLLGDLGTLPAPARPEVPRG